MKTWDYIERIRAKHGGCSDYRLSKLLGISQPAMTKYRAGMREADDEVSAKIAELLELPPMKVIADIHATRAQADGNKRMYKIWHDAALSFGRTAFFVAATGGAVAALAPTEAAASNTMVAGDGIEPPTRGFSIPCSTD